MKKIHILTIVFVFLAMITNAQQVQRDKVILELGTGTW
jgi:hypothetical protein